MREISNEKLVLGIPLNFPFVPAEFFDSFVRQRPVNVPMEFVRTNNGLLEDMRNNIVRHALDKNATHIIMMDTDMIYPQDCLVKLFSLCNVDQPVVGALCYRRTRPYDPLLFLGEPGDYRTIVAWEENSLVEVDATGTGCLMFHISIFQRMSDPWFEFQYGIKNGKRITIGEDIGFCKKVRDMGVKIFVDTSIVVEHLATMPVNHETFLIHRALDYANTHGETYIRDLAKMGIQELMEGGINNG